MSMDSLKDLYIDELKDLYNAENQLLKALPKKAKRSSRKMATIPCSTPR
jgi:ferritin-like metal-binding protein YciE